MSGLNNGGALMPLPVATDGLYENRGFGDTLAAAADDGGGGGAIVGVWAYAVSLACTETVENGDISGCPLPTEGASPCRAWSAAVSTDRGGNDMRSLTLGDIGPCVVNGVPISPCPPPLLSI